MEGPIPLAIDEENWSISVGFKIEKIGDHPGMSVWVLTADRETGKAHMQKATHLVRVDESDTGSHYMFAAMRGTEFWLIEHKGEEIIEVSWDWRLIHSAIGMEEIRDGAVDPWDVRDVNDKPVDWAVMRRGS